MTTTLETLIMRLKLLQMAAAAAAAVAAKAPSPQANERRMVKEKTATYREQGVVTLPGRFVVIASVSCINMWCSQQERRRSLALFA